MMLPGTGPCLADCMNILRSHSEPLASASSAVRMAGEAGASTSTTTALAARWADWYESASTKPTCVHAFRPLVGEGTRS